MMGKITCTHQTGKTCYINNFFPHTHTQDLIDIFNNFIDSTNLIGWEELQEVSNCFHTHTHTHTHIHTQLISFCCQTDVVSVRLIFAWSETIQK